MLRAVAMMDRVLARLPRPVVAIVAVVCVAGGVVLTVRPFTSVEVLVLLVGINAVLTGVLMLADRDAEPSTRRLVVGGAWVLLGVGVLAWPGLSVAALAVVVGVGLVVNGILDAVHAVTGRGRPERVALFLGGLTSVVFGVLALSWPDVTVFVVAVLFGARTVLFGLTQLISVFTGNRHAADRTSGERRPARGRFRRATRVVIRSIGLVAALALIAVSAAVHHSSPAISAFYTAPATIPSSPGVLIRTEPYTGHGIPDGTRGWLILYSTKTNLGAPAVASAVVLAPKNLPAGPRPVIAWSHGTVGIAQSCAPSFRDPFTDMPAIAMAAEQGWVTVATDYVGMGTTGVSPYLIGSGEAYATLDAVRAAHHITGLSLSNQTVEWGHSQGGHAALWTGILAPSYAPDLDLVGVAALSPATDLVTMADAVQGKLGGSLVSAYVMSAYSNTYRDVSFDSYIRAGARVQVTEAAKRCLADPGLLATIVTTLPATQSVFAVSPGTGAAGARLRQNTPTAHIAAPLLVAQGTSDEVIPISITKQWVSQQCAAGQHLDFQTYPDKTHMSVLATNSPLPKDLIAWTAARFAGQPAPQTC
jgi:uncharacterized membrane protein HdeD (DUF308 family)/alpha-beta hydrolase superfamily lysophospholipase